MKKFVFLAIVLAAFAALPVITQGLTPDPMVLPTALELLISAGVVYLVTEGLKALGSVFGVDITGNAAVIAASLTAAAVAFINGWLALIPPDFAPVAREILNLLVLLLAGGGIFRLMGGSVKTPTLLGVPSTELPARYLLIVTARDGLKVRSTPRPQSAGGALVRTEPVGAQLHASGIHTFDGVRYAHLIPRNPNIQEWVRLSESGGVPSYADVLDLQEDGESRGLRWVLAEIAEALRQIAKKLPDPGK